jgi:hypothetical protein
MARTGIASQSPNQWDHMTLEIGYLAGHFITKSLACRLDQAYFLSQEQRLSTDDNRDAK